MPWKQLWINFPIPQGKKTVQLEMQKGLKDWIKR